MPTAPHNDPESLLRSLAKWVGAPDDTPLLDLTCEVSAALEDHANHLARQASTPAPGLDGA